MSASLHVRTKQFLGVMGPCEDSRNTAEESQSCWYEDHITWSNFTDYVVFLVHTTPSRFELQISSALELNKVLSSKCASLNVGFN